MTDQQTTPPLELAAPNDASAHGKSEKVNRKTIRPWYKKKPFVLPLGLILLIAIALAVNAIGDIGTFGSTKGNSQSKLQSPPQAKDVDAGIGTKVRDGTFEYVVTGMERPGKTLTGKVGKTLTANGDFVIVHVDITNIGDVPQSPDCSCQRLVDDKGQEFEPSSAILSTLEALKFVQLINPASTVDDVLMLFDVAPGSKVVAIELHDSPLSQGVRVNLS